MIILRSHLMLIATVGMISVLGLPVPRERSLSDFAVNYRSSRLGFSSKRMDPGRPPSLHPEQAQGSSHATSPTPGRVYEAQLGGRKFMCMPGYQEPSDEEKISKIKETKYLYDENSKGDDERRYLYLRDYVFLSLKEAAKDPGPRLQYFKQLLNEYYNYALAGQNRVKEQLELYKIAHPNPRISSGEWQLIRYVEGTSKNLLLGYMRELGLADHYGYEHFGHAISSEFDCLQSFFNRSAVFLGNVEFSVAIILPYFQKLLFKRSPTKTPAMLPYNRKFETVITRLQLLHFTGQFKSTRGHATFFTMIISRSKLSLLITTVGIISVLGLPVPDEDDLSVSLSIEAIDVLQSRASQGSISKRMDPNQRLPPLLEPKVHENLGPPPDPWRPQSLHSLNTQVSENSLENWQHPTKPFCLEPPVKTGPDPQPWGKSRPTNARVAEENQQQPSQDVSPQLEGPVVSGPGGRFFRRVKGYQRPSVDKKMEFITGSVLHNHEDSNLYSAVRRLLRPLEKTETDELERQTEYFETTQEYINSRDEARQKYDRSLFRVKRKRPQAGDMIKVGLADEDGVGFINSGAYIEVSSSPVSRLVSINWLCRASTQFLSTVVTIRIVDFLTYSKLA
ncbi:hypothetical protein EV360DRAFT_75251 [Lentinula raphanica]|nr:hypothetical protein EV360DRAFT_75251 [Lentinula raphanica]